jgi:hypothetical protein
MSYYPDMQPLIIRVKPDQLFHGRLKKELERFNLDLDKLVRRIK